MNGARSLVIICATVMFCFVLGTAVAVIRLTTSNAALGIITLCFTNLGVMIAALASFYKATMNQHKLETIETHTEGILNGEMEAKIRAVIQDVITPENLTSPPQ